MNEKDFLDAVGMADEKYIEQAEPKATKIKKFKWLKITAAAACFVIFLAVAIPIIVTNRSDNKLMTSGKKSYGVEIEHNGDLPSENVSSASDLVWLSGNEIINNIATDIFEGEVTEIENIVLNFNGEKEYRAVAEIKVDKVLKGNSKENQTVSVLIPCAIKSNVWVEDFETLVNLRVGMKGIFLPTQNTETSALEMNQGKLYLNEVSDFSFSDGYRFAFLDTDKGLIFAKDVFKGISNEKGLEEIESYIESILEK